MQGHVAARHDGLSVIADVYYKRIRTCESLPINETNVLNGTFSGMIGAGYIPPRPGGMSMQAMVSVRTWPLETKVDVEAKIPALSIKAEARETWLDPALGTQADIRLTPKWSTGVGVAVSGLASGRIAPEAFTPPPAIR